MMLGYPIILAILIVMDIIMNSSFECDDYLDDNGIGLLTTPEEVAGAQLFSQALVQISACTLARISRRNILSIHAQAHLYTRPQVTPATS